MAHVAEMVWRWCGDQVRLNQGLAIPCLLYEPLDLQWGASWLQHSGLISYMAVRTGTSLGVLSCDLSQKHQGNFSWCLMDLNEAIPGTREVALC